MNSRFVLGVPEAFTICHTVEYKHSRIMSLALHHAHAQVDKLHRLVRQHLLPSVPANTALPLTVKFMSSQIDDYIITPQDVAEPLTLLKGLCLAEQQDASAREFVTAARRAAAQAVDAGGLVNPATKSMWSSKPLEVPPLEFNDGDEDDVPPPSQSSHVRMSGDLNDGALHHPVNADENTATGPDQGAVPPPPPRREMGSTQVMIHGVTSDFHSVTVVVKGWQSWFELALPESFPAGSLDTLAAVLQGYVARRFPQAVVTLGQITRKPRFYGLETEARTLLPRKYRYVKVYVNNTSARRALLRTLTSKKKRDEALEVGGHSVPVDLAADHMPLAAQFRADVGLVASKWFRVERGALRVCEWAKATDADDTREGSPAWQQKPFSSQIMVTTSMDALVPQLDMNDMGGDREVALDIENDSARRLFPDKYRGDSSTFISLAAQNTGLARARGHKTATMVRVVLCVGECAPLDEAEFPHTVLLCFQDARDMMEGLGTVLTHVMDADLVTGWYNYAHDFPFLLEEYMLQFHDPYLRMTEATVQQLQRCLRVAWKALDAEGMRAAGLQHCVGPVPCTLYQLHCLALNSPLKAARFLCKLPDLLLEEILPDLGASLPDATLKTLFNALLSPNGPDMPYVPGVRAKMAHRLKSKRDFKSVQTEETHGAGSMATTRYLAGTPEVSARQMRLALEADAGISPSEQQLPLPDALAAAPERVRDAAWTLFLTLEAQQHLSALVPKEFMYYFQGLPELQDAVQTVQAAQAAQADEGARPSEQASTAGGSSGSPQAPKRPHNHRRRRRHFAKRRDKARNTGGSIPNENVVQSLQVLPEAVLVKHGYLPWGPEQAAASGLSNTRLRTCVGRSRDIEQEPTWFTCRDRRGLQRLLASPQRGVDVAREGPLGLLVGRRLTKPSYMEVKYMDTGAKGDNCYLMWAMNGRVKHDMMQLVKDMRKPEKNSLEFALTSICKLPGKVELPYDRLFDLTERGRPQDLKEIAVYADRDATGPLDVMNHLKLPVILAEQSRTANTELDDICNGGQQVRSINLLSKYTHERGIALNTGLSQWMPNEVALDRQFKVNKNTMPVAYDGATVIDPEAGYYDDPTLCLDFASLYPSIIMSAGVCPSVLLREDEAKAILKFAAEAPPDYDWSRGGTVDISRMRPVVHVPGRGWRVKCGKGKDGTRPFCEHVPITQHVVTGVDEAGNVQEREVHNNFYWAHYLYNVVEDVLSGILRQRKIAKVAMNAAAEAQGYDSMEYGIQNGRQLGLKVIANSLYGFFGADTNPFGCKEMAASVTYFGRNIIEATQRMVTRLWGDQARTLYGDTDSVMVNYGNVQFENVVAQWHAMRQPDHPEESLEELRGVMKRWMEGAPTPHHAKLILTWVAALVTEAVMNQEFQEMGLYKIEIELEKAYYPYILFKKKNYAGLKTEGVVLEEPVYHPEDADKPKKQRRIVGWKLLEQPIYPTPKIDTKGIAAVRRDKTPLVRSTSKAILHELLVNRSIPAAFQRLVEVLRRFVVQPGVPEVLEDGRPCEGLGVDDFKTTKTTRSSYDMSKALPASAFVRQRRIARSDHGVPPVGARIEFVVLDRPAVAFDVHVAKHGTGLKDMESPPWPRVWEKPSTKYARTKAEKDEAKRAIGECAEDPEYVKTYGLPVDRQYYLLTVERAIKKLLQPMPEELPLLDTAFDITEDMIVRQQQQQQQQQLGENVQGTALAASPQGEVAWTERWMAKWAAQQLGKNPAFRDMRKRVFFDTSGKDMNQEAGTDRNVRQLVQYFETHGIYCNLFGSPRILHPELQPQTAACGAAQSSKRGRRGLSLASRKRQRSIM